MRTKTMSEFQVAVIGAGTMGAGIAQVAAIAGHRTFLCDISEDVLVTAKERIQKSLNKAVSRNKLDQSAALSARERLTTHTDRAAVLANVDIVIEAVPEIMALKKKIFVEIDKQAARAWLLGTNTSSLSISEIASVTERPERVVGLHFFNPPPIMKLVEVINASRTDAKVLEQCEEFVRGLGREPVTVVDAPGFATSRLGLVLGLEAMRMVEQGVAGPDAIDKAMELGYRHAMGPLKTTDWVGLDVRLAIAEHLFNEIGEAFRPPMILRRMVRAGKMGRKCGEGFYKWSDDGKCLGPNNSF
jgi:3-hydroxybutyryl-CoA dehydrogenase